MDDTFTRRGTEPISHRPLGGTAYGSKLSISKFPGAPKHQPLRDRLDIRPLLHCPQEGGPLATSSDAGVSGTAGTTGAARAAGVFDGFDCLTAAS